MYGLYGFSHNIQNIYKLSAPFLGGQEVETVNDLAKPYRSFLARLHSGLPVQRDDGVVVRTRKDAAKLISAFSASRINDLHQEGMIDDSWAEGAEQPRAELARKHIELLKRLNPELGELFDLAIHSILLCGAKVNQAGQKAHGGTSNKCIGLMWLNLKPTHSTQDILELYVHELTHTLVFLDELNFEHFDYNFLTEQEYWATSAILNRLRPMDKVLHSIIVSCEVLRARRHFLPNQEKLSVHPSSEVIRQSTLNAINSVLNHKHLQLICKPRAIELVERAQDDLLQA